jgi:S-adenosylmethionine:tRNA ribosyltransferase-isomerase
MSTRLADYYYTLPRELIADRPLPNREDSRMMVLCRSAQTIEHRQFKELKNLLSAGDLLVLNDTRVLAARKFSDDNAIEFLFLERLGDKRWKCLTKPGRKMRPGAVTSIDGVAARVDAVADDGARIIVLDENMDLYARGSMPLPPYLERASDATDDVRYQTVFAQNPGAIAAPTAGLHFTRDILAELPHAFVTLHVGPGTFRPVQSENVAEHKMHEEQFSLDDENAEKINSADRIIAVGTTTLRVLETVCDSAGKVMAQTGSTDIFIYPPFEFRAVDGLLTNFHLPRSTLLMLVSAFAGREFILRAYAEAIGDRYRFYSYGDCMLIL